MADRVLQTTIRANTDQFGTGMATAARSLEKFENDARQMGRFVSQTFRQIQTPTEKLELQMQKLDVVYKQGRVTSEEYGLAMKRLEGQYNVLIDKAIQQASAERQVAAARKAAAAAAHEAGTFDRFNESRALLHAGESRAALRERLSGRSGGVGFGRLGAGLMAAEFGVESISQAGQLTTLGQAAGMIGGGAQLGLAFGGVGALVGAAAGAAVFGLTKLSEALGKTSDDVDEFAKAQRERRDEVQKIFEERQQNVADRRAAGLRSARVEAAASGGRPVEQLTGLINEGELLLNAAQTPEAARAAVDLIMEAEEALARLGAQYKANEEASRAADRAFRAMQRGQLRDLQIRGEILKRMRETGESEEVARNTILFGPEQAEKMRRQALFNARQQAGVDLNNLADRFAKDAAKEAANRRGISDDRQLVADLLERSGATEAEKRRVMAALEKLEAERRITAEMQRQAQLAEERDRRQAAEVGRVEGFARGLKDRLATPEERFQAEAKRIAEARAAGALSDDQAKRGLDDAARALNATAPEREPQLAPLLAVGSAEAARYLAQLTSEANGEDPQIKKFDELIDAARQQVDAASETAKTVAELVAAVEDGFGEVANF